MKDRNFVEEIEKLRTAVLGYDREEVVKYYGKKDILYMQQVKKQWLKL